MPAIYAFHRFGEQALATLPEKQRRPIQRFRRLFDAGLHGPDIFYYQIPVAGSGPRFLGIRYHEQTGREFFQRCCRAARLERSEAAQAYARRVEKAEPEGRRTSQRRRRSRLPEKTEE